jgi:hypothetical protein
MKLFQKCDLGLEMAQLTLIPDTHRSPHHDQTTDKTNLIWHLIPLIDSNSAHFVTRSKQLLLNRPRALSRLVLDNQNFRHFKTIRNTILLRNSLYSIS